MRKILGTLLMALFIIPLAKIDAQSNPTLEETLKWIKEKFENPLDGAPKRHWGILDGECTIFIEKSTITWDDTKITVTYSGYCHSLDDNIDDMEIPVHCKYSFRLEDVQITNTGKDYGINSTDYEDGGLCTKTYYKIGFTTIGKIKKIERDYTAYTYHTHGCKGDLGLKVIVFEGQDRKEFVSTFTLYYCTESIRDRSVNAFKSAITDAKRKHPPKKEAF